MNDLEVNQVPGLVFVRERDISSLNASELYALSNDARIIAAVLPELKVNRSVRYDFRNVQLDPGVPAGLVLEWNGLASGQDNSSAQFFDGYGTEIFTVPEDHTMNVTAYFAGGNTYAPVITAQLPAKNDEWISESSGGGGGGCSLGITGIVFAAVCAAVLRKK